jgi:uncharacterized protein (TIGR02145 family)
MVDIRGFNGGLNTDASQELLPNGDYTHAFNVENSSEGLVNLLGNRILEGAPAPSVGIEWICGAYFDKTRQRIIYFTHNNKGNHRIISVDIQTEVHTVLFEDIGSVVQTTTNTITTTILFIESTQNVWVISSDLGLKVGDRVSFSNTTLTSGPGNNDGTYTVSSFFYIANPGINIITVSGGKTILDGDGGDITYSISSVISGDSIFDWGSYDQYNPEAIIKDIKVLHREYEGDLYYFIDPNNQLLKFNYDTLLSWKIGNTNLCAFGWTDANYSGITFRNGDVIPQVTDPTAWANLTTPAWCYYNNDPANDAIYGKLYNWYAINDPRGFAPDGYRVPSDTDWQDLIDCLGGVVVVGGFDIAGGKIKGIQGWDFPNTGATNESFLNALPGGDRNGVNGAFVSVGQIARFWTSNSVNATFANAIKVDYNSSLASPGPVLKSVGCSVRLIKD